MANVGNAVWASVALSLLVAASLSTFAQASDVVRPNVVLILSDDQGWRDYGFMGHDFVETPHLDELASESLVFPRGYIPSPLCRPSLASIITGLYPHQHGVCANDVDSANRAPSDLPVRVQFHRHPSLVRMLVANGYLAFQSGKWWEGSWADGGFTHGMTHGDPQRGGRHGDEGLKIGRQGMEPITDFIDHAIEQSKPFFVWYAPFLPHTPHTPPNDLIAKYRAEGRPENVVKYYAMCDWFDQTCGELLDHLERTGVRENTMVLYLADNGWAAVDEKSLNPPQWWNDYAPRSKGSPFEMGIRTPIMISWPARGLHGTTDALASSIDLMPTTLRACGIEPPTDASGNALPGIDLLDSVVRRRRDAVFGGAWSIHNMNPGNPLSTLQYRWCVTENYKLMLRADGLDTTRYRTVHNWDQTPARLYDLQADPDEKENLAEKHPDVVRRLTERIEAVIPAPQ